MTLNRSWGLLLIATVLLPGCAQNLWMKPGATVADFERMKAVCDYQSELGTPNENIGHGLSGAMASGISEGIRKGTLIQKCMIADGWHLEQAPTGAALAEAQVKKAQAKEIGDQRKVCITEIRSHPEYAPLLSHFTEMASGNYTMTQLADERIPSPSESRLVAAYEDEATPCVTKAVNAFTQIVPAVGPPFMQSEASEKETSLLLIQRKLTWGEAAQRRQRTGSELKAKLSAIRM